MSDAAGLQEKEIIMEVSETGGGGRRSRKRHAGSKRKTRASSEVDESAVVTKEEAIPKSNPNQSPTMVKGIPPVVTQQGGVKPAQTAQTVILAPPKKKLAKVMLIPKSKAVVGKIRVHPKKTFKAKRVRVTIDNTAKTIKHRKVAMEKIESMTEDQVRSAAVNAKLSRRETVAKVPIGLLRQMLKDYQSMRL
jgi:hypothetical protein